MAELDNLCGKISRVIFIVINLLLAVIGVAAIALGSYVVHVGRVQGALTVVIVAGAIVIVAGIIVLLVISAGLYGAVALSKILLGIYIFLVVVIIVLEIVGAILGFVFREKIVTYAGNVYLSEINDYRLKNDTAYKPHVNTLVDTLQRGGKCCGWNDTVGNWETSPYFRTVDNYPQSCVCQQSQPNCVLSNSTSQYIWGSTCKDSTVSLLRKNLGIIGAVGAVIAVIQLIPLFLAIVLMCTIHSDYKQV